MRAVIPSAKRAIVDHDTNRPFRQPICRPGQPRRPIRFLRITAVGALPARKCEHRLQAFRGTFPYPRLSRCPWLSSSAAARRSAPPGFPVSILPAPPLFSTSLCCTRRHMRPSARLLPVFPLKASVKPFLQVRLYFLLFFQSNYF